MADYAKVLTELQQERSRLDQAIEAIGKLVGKFRGSNANGPKRKISPAARRRIAAAQRARWAKWKSEHGKKAA